MYLMFSSQEATMWTDAIRVAREYVPNKVLFVLTTNQLMFLLLREGFV